jgi:sugar phosphate isomerase/epimerase
LRTLLLENTPNDLATPERLNELLRALHYPDLGVCFDTGHAHLMSSVHQAFGVLEDRIYSTHVHDNQGDRDSHLWPGGGTIDWNQTMQSLRTAPRGPALLLEVEGEEGLDVAGKLSEAYSKLEAAAVAAE